MRLLLHRNHIIFIVLAVMLLLPIGQSVCFANDEDKMGAADAPVDDSRNSVEPIPTDKFIDYKNDRDFTYWEPVEKELNLWQMFWRWLTKSIGKLFSSEGVFPYIRYVLILLLISFIVYVIFRGNISGIFSKNKKTKPSDNFAYDEEDIYSSDLDFKLNEALQGRNFRTAIRYYYLILLRKLDTNKLIDWKLGKTNRDYQRELRKTNFLEDYINLSNVYEYTWYGDFDVDEQHFNKWQTDFNDLFNTIN